MFEKWGCGPEQKVWRQNIQNPRPFALSDCCTKTSKKRKSHATQASSPRKKIVTMKVSYFSTVAVALATL